MHPSAGHSILTYTNFTATGSTRSSHFVACERARARVCVCVYSYQTTARRVRTETPCRLCSHLVCSFGVTCLSSARAAVEWRSAVVSVGNRY